MIDSEVWDRIPSLRKSRNLRSQFRGGSFLLALPSIAVSAKMSPIMNFVNDWIRMEHPRILQKEEVISFSCIMKGKTITL